MPAGTRVRANNAFGVTTDNPLTAGATSFNSTALTTLPAVVAGQHAVVVIDPKRVFGQPEIVIVTAHTGLSTTATITRGAYGTVAASHPVGSAWAHVAVDEDFVEILTSTSRPTDPYIGQSIFETDSFSTRYYTGTGWQSAPPIGTLLPYAGSTAPSGYLLANGAAVSRTGVTADLFAVVGTTYGAGDGSTTFNLPNFLGRVPVGRDAGQTEFDVLGETGGSKTYSMTGAELPQHLHGITDVNHNHSQNGHGHGTGFHGHGADDNSTGAHSHGVDGDAPTGIRIVITHGAGVDHLGATGGGGGTQTPVTVSRLDNNGQHDHNITVNNADFFMNNNVTATNNQSGTGLSQTNQAGSSTPVTGNNLQPYVVINYIIKI